MSRLLALRFQFLSHFIACIICFLWLISFHFDEEKFKALEVALNRRKISENWGNGGAICAL
jgi:hypothetical protein